MRSVLRPLDCDFETGECPLCGYMAAPHVHRNCPVKRKQFPPNGPGTELRKLLKEVGVKKACGTCWEWEYQMNSWGSSCAEHRAEIVARLKEAASESSWSTVFTAASGLITKPWFAVLDPFGSIVDQAIERAEANTPSPPPPAVR